MVYLNRIYTKSGDRGETSLGTGERVPKTAARIIAYGEVDELNSVLGVVLTTELPAEIQGTLTVVQNDLFDVGADLCMPESDEPREYEPLRVVASQPERLEAAIDHANESLEPLESFILPGGSPASAYLHLARTICRRAEISVLKLHAEEPVNSQVLIYLNRLSDLLFVYGRLANNNGRDDVLWVPGKNR
ncbi:Cob(I)yrinic acid a,c-diamide adenosyltransferase [Polystyrenella longa]|uniref:Corrinoid adenosyltransferase n=1 Tax=Polystyrenella longa TaxID=2528007 RepID=A0A518CSR6_9PLAN|nr:cob(I)yrinic acid a,c-diamide adenosyltransferase [Polystyrenella longa]QDU82277.1 Cob(I)yrinic acid a,c-diamide adenosyltransferase [Polystyrenella longa]